jgi:cytochrome P450
VSTQEAVAFDPFSLYQCDDPASVYRWLRDEVPVHHLEQDDLWIVSRYDDCVQVLRDPTTFSSKLGMTRLFGGEIGRGTPRGEDADDPFASLKDLRVLIAIDPPDHVRLRRLLSRPFTPRAIGAHESWIRPLSGECFDDLLHANRDGVADWVGDFTWPYPVMVIGRLMGIPTSLRAEFKRWSDDLVRAFTGPTSLDEARVTSFMEMFTFFHEAIAERRSRPSDDLISMLLHNAEDVDGEPLTADEVVLFCALLLIAGNETTTNLLSNSMKVLNKIPDMMNDLRADPALIPAFLEEMLRYEGPVHVVPRGTTSQIEVGTGTIPEDANVLVYLGAANRDDRHFDSPDRFDVMRNPTDHLGFGSGIHLCLGAPLARLEARIALETLVSRVASVEISAPPVLTGGLLLRGAQSMQVRITEL